MSKYNEGDRFEDDNGSFEVTEVMEDDPYDYYVKYDGYKKPDHIGKNEQDLDEARQL